MEGPDAADYDLTNVGTLARSPCSWWLLVGTAGGALVGGALVGDASARALKLELQLGDPVLGLAVAEVAGVAECWRERTLSWLEFDQLSELLA